MEEKLTKDRHFAYLAGLIDGEGNVGVYRSKNQKGYWGYALNINVSNSDRRIMKHLVQHFGGTFRWGTRSYIWKPNGGKNKASWLLNGIYPYLVVKHEQALLILDFIGLGRKICPDRRYILYTKTKKLNAVGVPKRGSFPEHTKSDWAYFAGLVDGEGHIRISKANQSNGYGFCYIKDLSIKNCSEVLMQYLAREFGGIYKSCSVKQPGAAPAFRWSLFGNKIQEKALLAFIPYLVAKKKQAVALLEFVRLDGQCNPDRREELMHIIQTDRLSTSPETNTSDTLDFQGVKIEPELHGNMQSVLSGNG